jgi:hypothetical protein
MKIISFKVINTGYEISVMVNGEKVTAQTYFDIDAKDKVKINNEVYELVGLSELKKEILCLSLF